MPSPPGRSFNLSRKILNRVLPGAMILMYHRVSPEIEVDPWNLNVTPQHFAEHMEILRRYTHLMPLQALNQQIQAGKPPSRGVAVTFDDGYADNLVHARPCLERYDIPATVFVVSASIGSQREFWWDQLERILLFPGSLPESLTLQVNGKSYHWELGVAAQYTPADFERFRSWDANWQAAPTARQQLFRSLHQLIRPLLPWERETVLDQLWNWADTPSELRPSHAALSAAELNRLINGGLVEAGAHTLNHTLLSALPPEMQKEEIQGSKAQLQEFTGSAVQTFAYPYGDYDITTPQIVRAAGFSCACSTIPDGIWFSADAYLLPRLDVKDWDGEQFLRRLQRWDWN